MAEYLRATFVTFVEDTQAEVFVVSEENSQLLDGDIFFQYLSSHADDHERYRILKEEAAGTSTKEYYTRKVKFFDEILKKAKQD